MLFVWYEQRCNSVHDALQCTDRSKPFHPVSPLPPSRRGNSNMEMHLLEVKQTKEALPGTAHS
jgi:hypothetical protein